MAYITNSDTVVLAGTGDADTLDATLNIFRSTLIGGFGNDTYIIDRDPSQLDHVIIEEAGGGVDTVRSYTSYALAAFVENLVLLDEAENGTGNGLNNTLTGNDENNTLDGGAGNDTLAGGLGDDQYMVDSALDVVIENANAGYDRVFASATFILGLNIEELHLQGALAINGTGNAGDNVLEGNAANNSLSGLAGDDLLDGLNGDDRLDGGTGNDRLLGGAGKDTLIGGAGDDTYMWFRDTDATDVIQEAANGGSDTVEADAAHTLAANVENLILTSSAVENSGAMRGNGGNNYIQGNNGDNFLFGEAGNDTLDGRIGADTMTGGAGNDTYVVDNWADRVVESAGATGGTADKIVTSVFYQLPDGVENIQLAGTLNITAYGNSLNNTMIGNSGNNFLLAFDGDDIIDGGAGADNLQGGLGNDTYYFDDVNDYAQEMRDEGIDTVHTSVSFNFYGAFNVENFIALGTGDLQITGNDLGNRITGNAGNNFINGRGGADVMTGGAGNDTYLLHQAGSAIAAQNDVVVEALNGGTDTVIAMVAYTLANNVENLLLGNTAGSINGTGNTLSNIIEGNSGVNVLSGLAGDDTLYGHGGDDTLDGGAGNDLLDGGSGLDGMAGGAGNDTYIVDRMAENGIVTEGANAGIDTVRSTVSWTLTDNFENLILLGGSGLFGTGNALNNVITGAAGNDTLVGANGNDTLDGGAGEDEMTGGLGNDIYVVDEENDLVVEAAGEGTDTLQLKGTRGQFDVQAVGDGLLSLYDNVENIVMGELHELQAKGNELSNTITGNSLANVLHGGGAGTDRLIGGKGNDIYVVDQASDAIVELANEGTDTVFVDFTPVGTYLLGANIEIARFSQLPISTAVNATGNALDNGIEGTQAANILDGGAGNDYLVGLGGGDTLKGGAGHDYMVANGGNASMAGGAGNDWYVISARSNVDDSPDATITEAAGVANGIDLIRTTVDFDMSLLAANVEDIYLESLGYYMENPGYFVGANANAGATGNALNNNMYGNLGDNLLNGGDGDDTFHFHSYDLDESAWAPVTGTEVRSYEGATLDAGDTVIGGAGNDALFAAIFDANDALDISGVEEITLYSGSNGSGENVIDATGITGADRITISDMRPEDNQGASAIANVTLNNIDPDTDIELIGFHANVTLDFADDVDDDVANILLSHFGEDMFGGSQTLTTHGVGTVALEFQQPSDGTGTSARMGASTDVEHVVLSGRSGEIYLVMPDGADLTLDHANMNVYLANHGTGNFPIYLNNSAAMFVFQDFDPVTSVTLDTGDETSDSFLTVTGTGAQTIYVQGAGNLGMALGQNLDASDMTGNLNAGTFGMGGDYSLRGGQGNDRLEGGSGNDTLSGGGNGQDELIGNGGSDTFLFDDLEPGHIVYTPDFATGIDKIGLDATVFTEVAGGVNSGNFYRGDYADMGSNRIAFDPTNGNLYYRATGDTADEAVLFGNVWYGNNVEATDFVIIS